MAGCQRQRWHQYHQKNEVFGEREKLLKFALACSKLGEEKKWNKIQEGKVGGTTRSDEKVTRPDEKQLPVRARLFGNLP